LSGPGGFTVASEPRARDRSTLRLRAALEPLDLLVAIALEPGLGYLVVAIERKRIRDQRAATRAERQAFDVPLLGEIGFNAKCIAARNLLRAPTASRAIFCAAET